MGGLDEGYGGGWTEGEGEGEEGDGCTIIRGYCWIIGGKESEDGVWS